MNWYIECPDGTLIRKTDIVMVEPVLFAGEDCYYFVIHMDAQTHKDTSIEVSCSADHEIAQNQLDLFRKRLQS